MTDRLRESFVGRLGKGKPASGMHFPMVDAVESVDGERAEGPGDDTEQSLHLDHLPLPEQRFESLHERDDLPGERLVH